MAEKCEKGLKYVGNDIDMWENGLNMWEMAYICGNRLNFVGND